MVRRYHSHKNDLRRMAQRYNLFPSRNSNNSGSHFSNTEFDRAWQSAVEDLAEAEPRIPHTANSELWADWIAWRTDLTMWYRYSVDHNGEIPWAGNAPPDPEYMPWTRTPPPTPPLDRPARIAAVSTPQSGTFEEVLQELHRLKLREEQAKAEKLLAEEKARADKIKARADKLKADADKVKADAKAETDRLHAENAALKKKLESSNKRVGPRQPAPPQRPSQVESGSATTYTPPLRDDKEFPILNGQPGLVDSKYAGPAPAPAPAPAPTIAEVAANAASLPQPTPSSNTAQRQTPLVVYDGAKMSKHNVNGGVRLNPNLDRSGDLGQLFDRTPEKGVRWGVRTNRGATERLFGNNTKEWKLTDAMKRHYDGISIRHKKEVSLKDTTEYFWAEPSNRGRFLRFGKREILLADDFRKLLDGSHAALKYWVELPLDEELPYFAQFLEDYLNGRYSGNGPRPVGAAVQPRGARNPHLAVPTTKGPLFKEGDDLNVVTGNHSQRGRDSDRASQSKKTHVPRNQHRLPELLKIAREVKRADDTTQSKAKRAEYSNAVLLDDAKEAALRAKESANRYKVLAEPSTDPDSTEVPEVKDTGSDDPKSESSPSSDTAATKQQAEGSGSVASNPPSNWADEVIEEHGPSAASPDGDAKVETEAQAEVVKEKGEGEGEGEDSPSSGSK
ncbi:hypothetical protein VTL71DRAFT_3041 [Oculimacula yallundae]|uniref:Uncharacterized protein n=1 Tax=Oculimacula yallundae TaxID=86028 RepID=A0ABR4C7U2_9HELO